ncbi:helix-turn-helix domain-containing protein [uncultured Litoreibacter sp.]|uniref:helix-turn-helix domain-containing protein n=1 Tax=uncultured Litoreibacter sp. TaxID=1392394 RepID=UPI002611360B|nr:helix-turn-helix domain-containing protein [uncultured Litoreibacter sp.]
MKDMDIAEVAAATGLTPATLRFYEKKGLILPSGRNGLRRLFDPSVLQTLSLIMLGQRAGFSLNDIKRLLFSGAGSKVPAQEFLAKADEIDRQVADLIALRDGLRHVAKCQAPTHADCPRFNRIMKAALSRVRRGASRRIGRV